MGGDLMRCEQCGGEQRWYHGCRDRHCAQCQGRATRAWAERQHEAVLPVTYYHLVFTLPHSLNGWVQLHPEVIYRLLFHCAWRTLKRFGRDPKRLGGTLGMSALLHTWGQTLVQHVHLHCLVPGGALQDGGQWKPAKSDYLFPVKALSRHFRGAMISALRRSAETGELARITRPDEVNQLLDESMGQDWVVYAKPCLNYTDTLVDYLARYTHRIAISNARIQGVDERGVAFRYKDYRDKNRQKTMHLSGEEFVRRFLLHVMPKGFSRIRHYGFLAGCCRAQRLAQIREALSQPEPSIDASCTSTHEKVYHCPRCKVGHLRLVALLLPQFVEERSARRR